MKKMFSMILSLIIALSMVGAGVSEASSNDSFSEMIPVIDEDFTGLSDLPETLTHSCKGDGSYSITTDNGNSFLDMYCAYNSLNTQSLVQTKDEYFDVSGIVFAEFDFCATSYNVPVRVVLNAGENKSIYPVKILKNGGLEYTTDDGTTVKMNETYDINTWYTVRVCANYPAGTMSVYIGEKGGKLSRYDITLSGTYEKYNYFRFQIPGWDVAYTKDGDIITPLDGHIYLDNLKIYSDVPALSLLSGTVLDGDTNVYPQKELTYTFNRDIDPECVAGIKLNGKNVDALVDGNVIKINLKDKPMPNTEYTLTLGAVSDIYGVIADAGNITFTTGDGYPSISDDFENGQKALTQKWYTNTFGTDGNGVLEVTQDPINSGNNALLLDVNTAQARIENPRYDTDGDGTDDFCLPGKAVVDFKCLFTSEEDQVSTVSFVHLYSKKSLEETASVSNTSLVRFYPKSGEVYGMIQFMDGASYFESGLFYKYNEWTRITLVVDLYTDTFKAYVNGNVVKDGYDEKIFNLKNPTGNANLIYNIQFKNNTVLNGIGSKMWIDDVTIAPEIELLSSKFVNANGDEITSADSSQTTFKAEFINNNEIADATYTLVMALYNEDGKKLESVKIVPVELLAGEKKTVEESFENIGDNGKIKVFYRKDKNSLFQISNILKVSKAEISSAN